VPTVRADARADRLLTDHDFDELTRVVDGSVDYVEGLFGHRFTDPPKIVAYATEATFSAGLAEKFDYSEGTAVLASTRYGALFDRSTQTIVVNMSLVGTDRLVSTLDHELTHAIVRELDGGKHLPAWFEEGIATIAERHTESVARWDEQAALVGRAIAAIGGVSLDQLDPLDAWHATYPRFGESLYQYAAQAVVFMRARIEWEGILRLLALASADRSIADAYTEVSGEPLTALERRLPASPQIIVRELPSGDVEWTLFSGKRLEPASVSIGGRSLYTLTFAVTTDDLAMYRGSFGSTAPPGPYVIASGTAIARFTTARR